MLLGIVQYDGQLATEFRRILAKLRNIHEERGRVVQSWASLISQDPVVEDLALQDNWIPDLIAQVRATEDALSVVDEGMTALIRKTLEQNAGVEYKPLDIRAALAKAGFPMNGRTNVMAEIHSVLKRLVKANQGYCCRRDGKKMLYSFRAAQSNELGNNGQRKSGGSA